MNDATINRRALLGTGLALGSFVGTASAAEKPEGDVVKLTDAVMDGYAGSPLEAANEWFFPGWKQSFVKTPGLKVQNLQASGTTINALVGGSGPPLLLLHGNPETHVTWHKVAPVLAKRFTVVLTDLRGYGDSGKPDGGVDHVDYCKPVMAQDQVAVMRSLGFDAFQVVAHDRGARVLQQMMVDNPEAVTRGVMLDIAPTDAMYGHTSAEFATRYFWWFLQIQDAPFPETLIAAAPRAYIDYHLKIQCKTPGAITGEAYAEYLRCYQNPGTPRGVCEDYRASATIDKRLDAGDERHKISQPILALWGAQGTVGQLFDVLPLWREVAANVEGHALPCGHLIPEEAPEPLLAAMDPFLKA